MTKRTDASVRERPKRWERRSDARPTELIAAALQCFAERGFAATKLDDVAARAGVSKATVYLYFENKEKLFEAVVRAAASPALDQAATLVDAYEGSTPSLVRTLLTVFEAALDGPFPAMAKIVIGESGNFPEVARLWADVVVRRGLELLRRIVERGVERGEFRPVDPVVVAPLVIAPGIFLGLWKQAFEGKTDLRMDRRAILAEHTETFLRGVAADGRADAADARRRAATRKRAKGAKR